jgi:hypothetical protein
MITVGKAAIVALESSGAARWPTPPARRCGASPDSELGRRLRAVKFAVDSRKMPKGQSSWITASTH